MVFLAFALSPLLSSCGSDDETTVASDDPDTTQHSAEPIERDGGVLFEPGSYSTVAAGEGHAWLARHESDGLAIVRVDTDGGQTDLVILPGDSHQIIPYKDMLAATYVTCGGNPCSETVVHTAVIDGDGSFVDERELVRHERPPGSAEGARLVGARDDLIWVTASTFTLGWNPITGETHRVEGFRSPCLLGDGLYAIEALGDPPETDDEQDVAYEVVIQQPIDDRWVSVPGSQISLAASDLYASDCLADVINTGSSMEPGLVWSPSSGWNEREPYTAEPMTVTAQGQRHQLFVLYTDGAVRRFFGAPDSPVSSETVEVPGDVFFHDPSGVPPAMAFDQSDTVLIGCAQQSPPIALDQVPVTLEPEPPPTCYIRSV